jgi:4-hydroxybenzoate polyprenyltransferase
MQRSLINYLILPKEVQSILFKSYVYFVPFLCALTIDINHTRNFFLFIAIFFLFELIINPSRYQLNDTADYKGDRQRHYHWQRPINEANKSLVLIVALSRFIFGTAIAFLLDTKLGFLAIAFLALQLFYDYYAKKLSPLLAIFAVSIAYPLRSLTIFYGLDVGLDKTSTLLLLSILFYSTYMVI